MERLDPATAIAVVTAMVAVAAAAAAIWQAVSAKRQAGHARRQADAADKAAAVAVSTLELQSKQDRGAEARLLRSQSSQISAWWGQSDRGEGWGVHLRNGSEAPVFQVHATVLGPDDRAEIIQTHVPVLPPGSDPLFRVLETEVETGDFAASRSARRVRITFTDEAGERWMRDQHGRLRHFEAGLVVVATDAPRASGLEQFTDEFQAAYGVTLTFEVIRTSISDELGPLFGVGDGDGNVDALIGAHDWIGGLAHHGLIEPTVLSREHREAFRPWTLDALTHDGALYGIPTTLDTTALIRNVDLAPETPRTMEDLIGTGNDLVYRRRVSEILAVRVTEEGDPFQIWPLFASAGGALFGRAGGSWDPRRIDLDTPASIAAFERLRSLGEQGSRLLRTSMDRTEALDLFASGRTAYLITTSDGLEYARRSGVRIAVSPVPPFAGGQPATAMSLVHGLFITREGRNQLLAHDLFSDYLTHRTVMSALSRIVVCPVALRDTAGQDADLEAYQRVCEQAVPMPSFRPMRHVWEIVGRAQADVIRGAAAEGAARAAAKELALAVRTEGEQA
ncbi:sugar ABC transporter substrate-binding protein [Symbioplanes lichenis]|uniref:sugar ABC transporter substrate-binding protein n=1 Tax=Symbioplanes lichenis TaxID=1629072 RepID=UPI002738BF3A|nr:extracellular solute-binding protein [Actinoplanes lichenis]